LVLGIRRCRPEKIYVGRRLTRKFMFRLESSIAIWRQQMLAAGINAPASLDELELHLREEIERQIQSGLAPAPAFEQAVSRLGQAKPLKTEFTKIDRGNWNRPLAWTAWTMFTVSFFLPSYADGWGWQCAGLAATAVNWPDFWHNWTTIHLASLTLANLLMLVSPFLLFRYSGNPRFMKWWRGLSLLSLALVWSFILLLITHADRIDLRFGCYVWSLSFLLLTLAGFKLRYHKPKLATN